MSEDKTIKSQIKERTTWAVGSMFKFGKDTKIITESDFNMVYRILDEAKKDKENYEPTEDGWFAWFNKWFIGESLPKLCGALSPQFNIHCIEPEGHLGNHKGQGMVWAGNAPGYPEHTILGRDEDDKLKNSK